jgi:AAA15 family ATPase/GTPase
MKIQKIEIRNFKTYKNVVFNCNEEFNFVIGCNNVGKSTFLEAIQLWKASFDKLIQTKSKGKKFY